MHSNSLRFFVSVVLFLVHVSMSTVPGSAVGQTPDGDTLAFEMTCEEAGLEGDLLGLCRSFAEAMDCPVVDSFENRQSRNAVVRNFEKLSGGLSIIDVLSPRDRPVADARLGFRPSSAR